MLVLSILMLLPVLVALPLRSPKELLHDPDLWWHLANARNLFTSHHFVYVEPYAFSVAGKAWINPEWLAEVPYWLGFAHLHLLGLFLVTWLLISANVALVYWRSARRVANATPAFWASVIGLGLMTVNSGPRTILCGYVCMSCLLWILDAFQAGRYRAAWFLPLLFCCWINLHGSWVIGIALFSAFILSGFVTLQNGTINQVRRPWTEQRTLLVVLGISLLALLVNPYGWQLVWNPFDMMWHQPLNIQYAEEWQPLHLSWFLGKMVLLSIGITIVAACVKPRIWRLHELVWVVFAWYAAFDHIRFTFLAAVITTPYVAEDLGRLIWSAPTKKTYPALNGAFAFGAILLFLSMMPNNASLERIVPSIYPEHELAAIQPSWHTFNQFDLGGRFAFEGKPSIIDSRMDTFEHEGVLKDYLDTIRVVQPLEMLDRYKVDHVLYREQTPLIYVLERSPEWQVTMSEGGYVLMARTSSMNAQRAGLVPPGDIAVGNDGGRRAGE
jgi:hypothetical protein